MDGYAEHPVDPRLAPYVECYWTHVVADGVRGVHPVMPDGCIDLLFDSSTASLQVVGTMTRTLWASDCGPTLFAGVRFRPGGAGPFLRERADALTDLSAGAPDLVGASAVELAHRLVDSGSPTARVRRLERFLLARLSDVDPVDGRIARAAAALRADPGRPVASLARELELSRQYLRRLFLHHTGLSPKGFARVARLGHLVEQLRTGAPLADVAAASGYADQAHMSREFKDMVGITPTAYRRVPFVQDAAADAA